MLLYKYVSRMYINVCYVMYCNILYCTIEEEKTSCINNVGIVNMMHVKNDVQ